LSSSLSLFLFSPCCHTCCRRRCGPIFLPLTWLLLATARSCCHHYHHS
jgi:hypothetical protein